MYFETRFNRPEHPEPAHVLRDRPAAFLSMSGSKDRMSGKMAQEKVPARPEEQFFSASRRVRVAAELDSTKETLCNLLPIASTQFKAWPVFQ